MWEGLIQSWKHAWNETLLNHQEGSIFTAYFCVSFWAKHFVRLINPKGIFIDEKTFHHLSIWLWEATVVLYISSLETLSKCFNLIRLSILGLKVSTSSLSYKKWPKCSTYCAHALDLEFSLRKFWWHFADSWPEEFCWSMRWDEMISLIIVCSSVLVISDGLGSHSKLYKFHHEVCFILFDSFSPWPCVTKTMNQTREYFFS